MGGREPFRGVVAAPNETVEKAQFSYVLRQWFRQKSGGDSAVSPEFVIAGMIFHPSRV
jgi:hypothetical protein